MTNFAVVLHGPGDAAAAAIRQIGEIPSSIPDDTLVTVSIGAVAYGHPDHPGGKGTTEPSLTESMSIADEALLAAKDAGRNTHIIIDADSSFSSRSEPLRANDCTSRKTMCTRVRPHPAKRKAIDSEVETLN